MLSLSKSRFVHILITMLIAIFRMAPLTRGAMGEQLSGQVFKEIMAELKPYNAEETILSLGPK